MGGLNLDPLWDLELVITFSTPPSVNVMRGHFNDLAHTALVWLTRVGPELEHSNGTVWSPHIYVSSGVRRRAPASSSLTVPVCLDVQVLWPL